MTPTICICGGGALGHVIAGVLSAREQHPLRVNILTRNPSLWSDSITTFLPHDQAPLTGQLSLVSDNPQDVIPQSEIVLICLPGHLIKDEIAKIKPYLTPGTFVGCVFSSTGFFFEAQKILPRDIRLWGFQRVPYIARVREYGRSANLLGYKTELQIAVEGASDTEKSQLRQLIEMVFDCPTKLLGNYLEASISNSNPLLHTSRLYSMFKDWYPGVTYPRNYLFYEEWTLEAAELYIRMDEELAELIRHLPVNPDFLPSVLDYYESHDAVSLRQKIASIPSFKGIISPMKEIAPDGWIPDLESRYFIEDFGCSLRYIWQLAKDRGIDLSTINKVYHWGASHIK